MKKQNRFQSLLLAAVLMLGASGLSGCSPSRPEAPDTADATEKTGSFSAMTIGKIAPVSISSLLKDRTKNAASDSQKLLEGFDWFYDDFIRNSRRMDYLPEGAERVTDDSQLKGSWIVTHYRYPGKEWQKQILTAELETDGKTVSYTEQWKYIFYQNGTEEDARNAAHDLPYSGTTETDPLTLRLEEEYFGNRLTYTGFFKRNGMLYAVGTYYSDYDGDLGYAAMYKVLEERTPAETAGPAVHETPGTAEVKPEPGSETGIFETVSAPEEMAFLEGTWKNSDHYFTIRFLSNGMLNYIQYSPQPLGEDTGFGGMDAHYAKTTACEYSFDRAEESVSFPVGSGSDESVVLKRGSSGSLLISTYKNRRETGPGEVTRADAPTVFVPWKS